ncbi:hypothetical protein [Dechloromonas sp.]|uniref:hypothetical protein n=1 Tax=Dechloromonas sp. TaxID=1917218 RepID=UPI001207FF8E|nr:hypothetical protein [Dechloromonas sp.]MBU3695907.1 hypothetical protein [Dechloromonas sp.]TEX48064.1 MAG: hypothetical protein CFR70_07385 [Rhodocyclaceae bacterium]
MDNKPSVFLAAADRDFIDRIKVALHGTVNLNVFNDGEACRRALAAYGPQALILDTRLPGGYELHRAIRDDFDTGDIYQLLLCTSEEASCDDLVADNFLLRPVADGVVLGKIRLLLQTLEQRRRCGELMAYAQKVAMTAISSMGEVEARLHSVVHALEVLAGDVGASR